MLMKDSLDKEAIFFIAEILDDLNQKHRFGFNHKRFTGSCIRKLDQQELKQRVKHISECLHQEFPKNYLHASKLLQLVPDIWARLEHDDPQWKKKRYFSAWPLIDYSMYFGLNYPEEALKTLATLTHLYSAEFAIRPFIQNYKSFTLNVMSNWCSYKNEHIRRLVSEGLRPRLPWGIRLHEFVKCPDDIIPLLERLKLDRSLYVRRSIANNLNDISKDHPQVVIDLCSKWLNDQSLSVEQKEGVQWLVKHGLRSLIKNGNSQVFPLLGYTKEPRVSVQTFKIFSKKVSIGEDLEFEFTLKSLDNSQRIVVDYVVYFLGVNGQYRKKVFKFKNIILEENKEILFKKKQSFKLVSTRVMYPGKHYLALHINGIEQKKLNFHLYS